MERCATRGDRGYAICASARSGSNLLCQYLASTGQLGYPLEYFNGGARRVLGQPDFPLAPLEQIEWILTSAATANGIYGVKVLPWQLDQIAASVRWTELLPNLMFVRVKRRDLVGQAISALRAEQTKQWRSTMPRRGVVAYDGPGICRWLRSVVHDQRRWDLFFARGEIDPVLIVYEDLVADPQAAVDRVAQLFGLEGKTRVAHEQIDLEIQRDATTEEWRARFRAEYRGLDELESV